MAKKRKGTPVDPAFAMFQAGAPEWREPAVTEEKKDPAAAGGANDLAIRALQEQISMLRDMNSRAARASTALLSQNPADNQPPRVITEMNLDNLPDPVTDPQGYAKEIARRGQEMIASQRNYDAWAQRQAQQHNEALNGVWERFAKDHSEYAAHDKLFTAAAANVVNAARSRNIDPNKLVLGDTDNFFEDVMKEMRELAGGEDLFKKADGEGDENEDETVDMENNVDPIATGGLDDDGPDGRTAGVFGGADSGNKPGPSKTAGEVDMFSELKQWQQKQGWHL